MVFWTFGLQSEFNDEEVVNFLVRYGGLRYHALGSELFGYRVRAALIIARNVALKSANLCRGSPTFGHSEMVKENQKK